MRHIRSLTKDRAPRAAAHTQWDCVKYLFKTGDLFGQPGFFDCLKTVS